MPSTAVTEATSTRRRDRPRSSRGVSCHRGAEQQSIQLPCRDVIITKPHCVKPVGLHGSVADTEVSMDVYSRDELILRRSV